MSSSSRNETPTTKLSKSVVSTVRGHNIVSCLRTTVVTNHCVSTLISGQKINNTSFPSITKPKITNNNCLVFAQGFLLLSLIEKWGTPRVKLKRRVPLRFRSGLPSARSCWRCRAGR